MKFSIIALSASAFAKKLTDQELLELGEYDLLNELDEVNYDEPVQQQISQVQANDGAEQQYYENSDDEETEEEAARFPAKEQGWSKKYAAHPHNKARYEFAKDACKNVPEKKRKACFTRNWRIYKPAHSNTIHDFRARAHRKCWQYKNAVVKLHDCFAKYIKTYEGELHQLLLGQVQSDSADNNQFQFLAQTKANSRYVNRFVRNAEAHVREISTASSEDSHSSESSSNESSDPDYQTTGVGERKSHHPKVHPQGADAARKAAADAKAAKDAKHAAKKAAKAAAKPAAKAAAKAQLNVPENEDMDQEQRPAKKAKKAKKAHGQKKAHGHKKAHGQKKDNIKQQQKELEEVMNAEPQALSQVENEQGQFLTAVLGVKYEPAN